jgi:hypothetical protein
MAREVLRDPLGQILATIETTGNGNQTIKDHLGKTLGTYDKKSNTTRNYLGQLIGTGNLLTTLIRK